MQYETGRGNVPYNFFHNFFAYFHGIANKIYGRINNEKNIFLILTSVVLLNVSPCLAELDNGGVEKFYKLKDAIRDTAKDLVQAGQVATGNDGTMLVDLAGRLADAVDYIDTLMAMTTLAEGNIEKNNASSIMRAFITRKIKSFNGILQFLNQAVAIGRKEWSYNTINYVDKVKRHIREVVKLSSELNELYLY